MIRIKISENFEETVAKIKVIGIGGGGGNAVNRMIEERFDGVTFISANTDAQVLRLSKAPIKIQLGEKLTEGKGAGGSPDMGARAAEESREIIKEELLNTDLLFITAGMGGGTGTGAAPIIAEIAKSMNILTVAIVTKPFNFEGPVRMRQAENGLKELRSKVDTIITIPNERLVDICEKDTGMKYAFLLADQILHRAVQSISDVITTKGEINVDFADVKGIMTTAGDAIMGMGQAKGENAVDAALQQALNSPLLDNLSINGANRGVLVNITGSSRLPLTEAKETMDKLREQLGHEAHVFFGFVIDENLQDEVKLTLIATGLTNRRTIRHLTPDEMKQRNHLASKSYIQEPTAYVKPSTLNKGDIFRPAALRKKKNT
ncbi:MAG: cell division protein FtsZ [Elusimicrobiota bacterium]